jgi:CO/xanthine dehydrogenase Mo-binding subunit
VQIKDDGQVYVWSGSQKPHYVQEGVANTLNLPIEKVHAKWITGPGSYGRNDADDAASDAALLAKHSGKTVRLQYMRNQGTGWDPKGPASVHTVKAGLDADGNVIAYDFFSKGFSRIDVNSNGSKPRDCLAGHLTGVALKSGDGFGVPSESYAFPNKRLHWATIAPLLDRASPLRTSHLRDPVGPQIHFASESFIDELAVATNTDSLAFRMKYASDKRDREAMQAAADKHGWDSRVSGAKVQSGPVVTGRGIAFSSRNGTRVAVIAEVEVNRDTGKVWGKRFTVAHDCGQLVNPRSMHNTIEGNIVQGASRTIHEEVRFDEKNILSVDWATYPILDITEKPEIINVVLIDHPELPMTGAGEPSTRPVAAAIANAVFDATGVRMRRAPLNPENVKAALAHA